MEVGKVDSYPQWSLVAAPVPVSSEIRAEQDRLIKAVRAVNESKLAGENREMTYSVDPSTRRIVFKLIDKETQDVVMQVPAEYLLRLAEMSSRTE
jgi:flagellar protein FlaG